MNPWNPSTTSKTTPPKSGPGKFDAVDPEDDPVGAEAERADRADRPDRDPDHLDRLRPEAGEDVQRQAHEAQRRVARGAGARGVVDVDLDHAGTAGEDERLRELLLADRAEHRRHDLAAVRVERAAEVGDLDAREAAEHAVDHPRGKRATPGVAAGDAAPAGDVVAALDGREQPGNVLGRVLQVAVHRHDDLAARAGKTRVHRGVLAEVALEADGAHACIGRVEALELREGAVGRAVVDEDQLVRTVERVERGDRPPVQLVERSRLVVERDDDGDVRRRLGLRNRS